MLRYFYSQNAATVLGFLVFCTASNSCGMTQELAQKAGEHQLQTGDIVGIYIEGDSKFGVDPPIARVPTSDKWRAYVGQPLQLLDNGTLTLPFIDPIKIAGMTLRQAEIAMEQSYKQAGIEAHAGLTLAADASKTDIANYRARCGDVLALDFPMVFGPDEPPPIHGLDRENIYPCSGFPILIHDDGKIRPPLVSPIFVKDKSLSEIRNLFIEHLIGSEVIKSKDGLKLYVSLMWQMREMTNPVSKPIGPGDVVALCIDGILGTPEDGPPVTFGRDEDCGPVLGYPFQIDRDGKLELPFVGKIEAAGLTTSHLVDAIRKAYVDKQVLVRGTWIDASIMEKHDSVNELPRDLRIGKGDILTIVVEGCLPKKSDFEDVKIPVHIPKNPQLPPSFGFKILVRDDGTILLPGMDPIRVVGKTLEELKMVFRPEAVRDVFVSASFFRRASSK